MIILKKSLSGNYNAGEVNSYIKNLRKEYELSLKDQRKRIVDLRDDNKILKSKLETYQKKEKALSNALIEAENHKVQLIAESTAKANLIENNAKQMIKYYNTKLSSLIERIYSVENNAISVLQSVIVEIAKLREREINNDTEFKLNSEVEKIISTKSIS